MNSISHKSFLALAIPFTIATVTQPLLGAVDTAVVGRLENATYIGGVAIGTTIFNSLYWLFGFLRIGTSGFSAQSLGAKNEDDRYYAFLRPAAIGAIISVVFIVLQYPIIKAAMAIYQPDPGVARHALTYYNILIWGAPFSLIGCVNLGWLMGQKRVKESLFLQVSANVLNIILDIVFVMVFKMDVAGVAWATLISQAYGFFLGIFLISKHMSLLTMGQYKFRVFESQPMKKMLGVNRDLMIKTICGLVMINMFVAKGSALGSSILAANAILIQIHYIIGYCFDGFANASSIFVGEAVGENNVKKFNRTVSIASIHGIWMSLTAVLVLMLFREPLIFIFTDITEVVSLCHQYMLWVVILPLLMGVGLVFFGFYNGATYTKPLRNSQLISLVAFAITYYIAVPLYHNHGLWLAYCVYITTQSSVLIRCKNQLIANVFSLKEVNLHVRTESNRAS